LLVVQILLNMFRASLCPLSGAYQLQQQPLVYRRNVVVAVLLVVVGPAGLTTANSTATIHLNQLYYILRIRQGIISLLLQNRLWALYFCTDVV